MLFLHRILKYRVARLNIFKSLRHIPVSFKIKRVTNHELSNTTTNVIHVNEIKQSIMLFII